MSSKGDILIIDDDPDFCEIAKKALEAESFSVRCACNGVLGLSMLREKRPDLIFLDVIMVVPDEGVFVSQEIARDPTLRDTAVVMISSIADSEYIGHFPTDSPLHVDLFLDKPIQLQKLVEVADRFAGQGAAAS